MGKKPKLPPGTWLEREMFESKAYLALKGIAPQLLTLILGKRQIRTLEPKTGKAKRICVNRDSIHFTYIEAEKKYGISKPRFTRAISELLAKGFISIKHHGGAYRQDKTVFALSDNQRPEFCA